MKKLNRKGFTLVELLAVIIILAIVVGITIPAVLTTTSKAKGKAFKTAAQTAADWIDRQYQVARTGISEGGDDAVAKLDSNFINICGTNGSLCHERNFIPNEDSGITQDELNTLIPAVGLKTSEISKIELYININTGRSCVRLTAVAKGDYDDGSGTLTTTGGAC